MKDVKAFIMAAGFGTRLEPLTLAVPKPMVPILNKPVMQHNLELLSSQGIRDVYANIHYFPEQIENFFGDGSSFGVNLCYSFEEKLLGTAGGVRRMASIAGGVDSTFLVLSSDALTDIDLRALLSFHRKKKALATIVLYSVLDTSQFGVVVLDEASRVTAFQEKPLPGKALSDLANTGIYIFEPEVLEMIPKDRFYDFGKDLFPEMVGKRLPFFGYQMKEYWSDVGGIEQYVSANMDALKGRIKIPRPRGKRDGDRWIGEGVKIAKGVKLKGPVLIGDRVKLGNDVEIEGPAMIGDKCIVKDGARINGSIVWSDTYIGKNGHILDSVIGSWCYVDDNVTIGSGCVMSNRCRISEGASLPPQTKMKPDSYL